MLTRNGKTSGATNKNCPGMSIPTAYRDSIPAQPSMNAEGKIIPEIASKEVQVQAAINQVSGKNVALIYKTKQCINTFIKCI
jgi:hypothetical protein